jgi:hypothetical protein
VTETVYHIDICGQCGSLLIREAPRCLVCGFNAASGAIELVESVPASPVMPTWGGIVDAMAGPVAWLRAPWLRLHGPARHRPTAGADQRGG